MAFFWVLFFTLSSYGTNIMAMFHHQISQSAPPSRPPSPKSIKNDSSNLPHHASDSLTLVAPPSGSSASSESVTTTASVAQWKEHFSNFLSTTDSSYTVLIAEDGNAPRKMIIRQLVALFGDRITILEATEARRASEIFDELFHTNSLTPDFILTDFNMNTTQNPGLDGDYLVHHAREAGYAGPILSISSDEGPHSEKWKCADSTVEPRIDEAWLGKPITYDALCNALCRLLHIELPQPE